MPILPAKSEQPANLLAEPWRLSGSVNRQQYTTFGATLFGIKYAIDYSVATYVFHEPWGIFSYIFPGREAATLKLASPNAAFVLTMAAIALPFVWTGVALTIRRLRDANMNPALAGLFFVPTINLIFFLIMTLIPGRPTASPRNLDKTEPLSSVPQPIAREASFAIVVTAVPAYLLAALGIFVLGGYGWGLFFGIPFAAGMSSAYLYGRHMERSFRDCLGVACTTVTLLGLAMFFMAAEGIICMLMAAPIVYALAIMGAWLGYNMQRRYVKPIEYKTLMIALLAFMPFLMGAEYQANLQAPIIGVVSTCEIAAPPPVVWKNVIAFPKLAAPTEPLFKLGVAYPIGATISGRGSGAVRRCKFSTGAFVEPIKVWDEPNLLQFGVQAQPPSMNETSWAGEIHPKHLEGYLIVHAGQFHLTPIKVNGETHTRLEGTTWYQNRMWPNEYWRLWSDNIIHTIHMRVLRHIKAQSETT